MPFRFVRDESPDSNGDTGFSLAFTDLMIGVVFLLLIIISVLSLSYRSQIAEDKEKLSQADELIMKVAKHKKEVAIIQKQVDNLKQQSKALTQANNSLKKIIKKERDKHISYVRKIQDSRFIPQHLLKQLAREFSNKNLPITINFEQSILHFSDSVLFATNSSSLTKSGKKVLKQVGEIFSNILPCYSQAITTGIKNCNNFGYKQIEGIFIEGHTDNVPFEDPSFDNWALSMSRAKATYQYLLVIAPKLENLKNKSAQQLFSLSAYADSRPIASNDTRDGRAKNRRIDIRLISFGYIIKQE